MKKYYDDISDKILQYTIDFIILSIKVFIFFVIFTFTSFWASLFIELGTRPYQDMYDQCPYNSRLTVPNINPYALFTNEWVYPCVETTMQYTNDGAISTRKVVKELKVKISR